MRSEWTIGMRAEAQQTAEGLVGAWYRGEIIEVGSETVHIRYDDFFDEEGACWCRDGLACRSRMHAMCKHVHDAHRY